MKGRKGILIQRQINEKYTGLNSKWLLGLIINAMCTVSPLFIYVYGTMEIVEGYHKNDCKSSMLCDISTRDKKAFDLYVWYLWMQLSK